MLNYHLGHVSYIASVDCRCGKTWLCLRYTHCLICLMCIIELCLVHRTCLISGSRSNSVYIYFMCDVIMHVEIYIHIIRDVHVCCIFNYHLHSAMCYMLQLCWAYVSSPCGLSTTGKWKLGTVLMVTGMMLMPTPLWLVSTDNLKINIWTACVRRYRQDEAGDHVSRMVSLTIAVKWALTRCASGGFDKICFGSVSWPWGACCERLRLCLVSRKTWVIPNTVCMVLVARTLPSDP